MNLNDAINLCLLYNTRTWAADNLVGECNSKMEDSCENKIVNTEYIWYLSLYNANTLQKRICSENKVLYL